MYDLIQKHKILKPLNITQATPFNNPKLYWKMNSSGFGDIPNIDIGETSV